MNPIVRHRDVVSAEVDGEVVALNAATGVCFGLNGTGSRVWQLAESPVSVAALCARLVEEFDVEPAACEAEVRGLVEELLREGLFAEATGDVATTPG